MSNSATVTTAAAPVIIAPSMRKSFKAVNFVTVITGKLSFPDSEIVRPSMVTMDKATAAAAMGAACSPVSFVTGLLHNMASFSHGQKLDGLCLGLPVVAAFAVRHACGLLSLGKGADCKTMKTAATSAIDAVLALKTKAEQAAEQAKIAADIDGGGLVIVGESVRVTEQAAAPVMPWVNGAAKAAAAHDALWAQYGDKAAADYRKATEQAAAPSFVDLFATLAKNHAEQAAAMLPTMAAACGLVVITAEQAAMLKAAEQAAAVQAAAPKKSRAKKAA